MIAIVVLTHNRVHLLRLCVSDVLLRTSDSTTEIVIWNNGSNDGTADFLASIEDPRIRVVNHEENIGQNAYARAFALTSAEYMVELDDDVISAPSGWDKTLLDAYRRLPTIGFLAASLEDDPHDVAANVMYRERPHLYRTEVVNGIRLLRGPTGGGCAMTSRELHNRAGGFREHDGSVFWLEDAAYIEDIEKLGYEAAFLADLQVHHAGGPFYAPESPEKHAYWVAYHRARRRREFVKGVLLRVPFVGALNTRYEWFRAPETR